MSQMFNALNRNRLIKCVNMTGIITIVAAESLLVLPEKLIFRRACLVEEVSGVSICIIKLVHCIICHLYCSATDTLSRKEEGIW